MVDAALDKLHKTGGADPTFERWFGQPNGSNVQQVERVLTNMQHALADDQYTFVAQPATQDNWELAHVFGDPAHHDIYVRPHFFDHAFGPKTPETTIAHELSHFNDIGGTKDYVYGPDNVRDLANRDSYTATHNAENYGMFIRDQMVA
ncbi:MAG TPA: M35 family metallopeptidase [Paraburkholderia sp.]